jgi:hypothetical protein
MNKAETLAKLGTVQRQLKQTKNTTGWVTRTPSERRF